MKKNYLGDILYRQRLALDLTQDEFGAKYSVSGPAVFKFEKGYVRPSLALWLRMAADTEISERRAVLLWLKSRLPENYQDYVELQGAAVAESEAGYGASKKNRPNYGKFKNPAQARAAARDDETLSKGFRAFLQDDETWVLYKPSGREINLLRDLFGRLGPGSKSAFREALCTIREFTKA